MNEPNPLRARRGSKHTCDNGHAVPVLVQVGCTVCSEAVAYEPCSIGMALYSELDRYKDALEMIVGMLRPSPSHDAQVAVELARKALDDA